MPDNVADFDQNEADFQDVIQEKSAGKPLRLDQFLKLCGVADTGGQAKQIIQAGEVILNGEIETRRRKKLSIDDVIEVFDSVLPVAEFFSAE